MPTHSAAYRFMLSHWDVVSILPRGRFTSRDVHIPREKKAGVLIRMKWLGLIRRVGWMPNPSRGDRYSVWKTTDTFRQIAEQLRRDRNPSKGRSRA